MYNYRNGKGWQPMKAAARAWDTVVEPLGILGIFLALIILGMSSSLRAAPLNLSGLPGSPLIDTSDTRITYTYNSTDGGLLTVQGFTAVDHDLNAGTPDILAVEQSLVPPDTWGTGVATMKIRNEALYGATLADRQQNWSDLGTDTLRNSTEYFLQAKFDTLGNFVPGVDSFYNIRGIVDAYTGFVFFQDSLVFDSRFDPTLAGSCFGICSQGDLMSGRLLDFGFTGNPSGGFQDKVNLEFNISVDGGDFYTIGYKNQDIKPDHGIIVNGDVLWNTTNPNTTPSALTSYNTVNTVNGWDTDLDNLSGALLGNWVSCNGCQVLVKTFVPVPAAVWLFGSGLFGLLGIGVRNRRRSK